MLRYATCGAPKTTSALTRTTSAAHQGVLPWMNSWRSRASSAEVSRICRRRMLGANQQCESPLMIAIQINSKTLHLLPVPCRGCVAPIRLRAAYVEPTVLILVLPFRCRHIALPADAH